SVSAVITYPPSFGYATSRDPSTRIVVSSGAPAYRRSSAGFAGAIEVLGGASRGAAEAPLDVLPLRRLPELIDLGHGVDHCALQLAAHLVHAADVGRDHRVLLVVEPEGPTRRLEADLAKGVQEARLILHVPVHRLQRLPDRLGGEIAEMRVVDGLLLVFLV